MTASGHHDLHAEVTGTGPSLVLLPPVGLGAWVWRPVAARLATQRTVVAVDLPGFGSPSLCAGSPWAVVALARDMADAPLAATLPHAGRYRFGPTPDIGRRITVAWGSRDRLLPPRQARRAEAALPAARHVELPGAGHLPFWDAPAQLAALILDPAG